MAYRRLITVGESLDPVRNNFDALRLAMALMVIWSHSFAIHTGSEQREWFSLLLHRAYNAGNIGVMAFFVISGFLITQSYERSRSTLSYFVKRVRRIYPGYMVATTISGLLFIPFIAPTAHVTALDWLVTIAMNLLLQGYSPAPDVLGRHDFGLASINGALWSIPYEFWCYIGVALLGTVLLLKNGRFLLFCLGAFVVAHLSSDFVAAIPWPGTANRIFGQLYLWTTMAPCFILGMLVYRYRTMLPRSRALLAGLLIASIGACWIHHDFGYIVFLPSLAYAIFYVSFADNVPLHNAARFGDFSYGTYLYGFLIQKVLQFTIARSWNLAEFFAASIVLSLLAGVLSWHLVEKWFLPRRLSSPGSKRARRRSQKLLEDVLVRP